MLSNFHQPWIVLALVIGAHCQMSTTWASSRFIGYYVAPDSTEPLLAGNSWVTSATFAGDCSSNGRCAIATECKYGTLYYDNDSTVSCTGEFTCVQMTIFATSPNVLPSAYNYNCRYGWRANTIYRELAATTTSSSFIASSTITPSPTTPTSTPSSTNATSVPTSAPSPTSRSQAWIAGAVLGPVFGIALIAAAVFWFRRRKRGSHNGGRAHELGHGFSEYASVKQYHEKEHTSRPVELPSSQQPSELATDRVR